MAYIDKTYVNKKQLLEAIKWANEIGECTLDCGHKFKPLNYIKSYNYDEENKTWYYNHNDIDEYVLWNTPIWYDRWLWLNCPLSFVRERLQEQYDEDSLKEFENWKYEITNKRNTKIKFLTEPIGKGRKWDMSHLRLRNPWSNNCIQATYYVTVKVPNENFEREYNSQLDNWFKPFSFIPTTDEYIWQQHHKRIPNKKSIVRQIKKWNLPKGTIVTLKTRWYGLDFKAVVK